MRRLVLLALAGLVTACATQPPTVATVRTVEVKVPVPTPCIPAALGPAPAYPDTAETLRAAPDAADRYRLVAAGRLLRDQRLAELEPVVEGCR